MAGLGFDTKSACHQSYEYCFPPGCLGVRLGFMWSCDGSGKVGVVGGGGGSALKLSRGTRVVKACILGGC